MRLDIFLGANEKFAMPLAVTAHSALRHIAEDHKVYVHIMSGGISSRIQSKIQRTVLAGHHKSRIVWHEIDQSQFDGIEVRQFSVASLFRLLIPDLLDDASVERALYLDSDIIVNGDLSDLWSFDFGTAPIAAVDDGDKESFNKFIRAKFPEIVASDHAGYFNSGVLLFNLHEWRLQNLTEKTIKILRSRSFDLAFQDQCALNAATADNWAAMPARWNKQVPRLGEPQSAKISEPGILHFSSHKPWRPMFPWAGKLYFHEAYIKSRWDGAIYSFVKTGILLCSQIAHHIIVKIIRKLTA